MSGPIDDVDAPAKVEVVSPVPIPVVVTEDRRDAPTTAPRQNQRNDPSLPAKTTFQQDLTQAGQRRINLIWEYTQALIAVLVVLTTMAAGLFTMYVPTVAVGAGANLVQVPTSIPTVIGVAFGMVTGFYFSRTNHAAIGGVGTKPEEPYVGR